MAENAISKQELTERFHELPPWTSEDDFSDENWAQFIALAKVTQSTNSDTVEAALNEFIQQTLAENYQGWESESKPFLLMRIVFELPELASVEKRFSYKGWMNWPEPDEQNNVNLSWPVSWQSGHPRLLASYDGSMGRPYAAAAEYRFLLQNYPYREL